jgi:hypothetical protein
MLISFLQKHCPIVRLTSSLGWHGCFLVSRPATVLVQPNLFSQHVTSFFCLISRIPGRRLD